MALEEGTDNLMRRVTDVDMNIDIGQGLHVGSVAKEKGLVLDREVEIEGDEEELAPKFLNFIFLLYGPFAIEREETAKKFFFELILFLDIFQYKNHIWHINKNFIFLAVSPLSIAKGPYDLFFIGIIFIILVKNFSFKIIL